MALLFPAKVQAANAAIQALDAGTPSVTYEGKNYTSSNIAELYAIKNWYGAKAAIEKAEEAQSYGVGSRNLTRANIKDLYDRERQLAALLPEGHPGRSPVNGTRLRRGVPE